MNTHLSDRCRTSLYRVIFGKPNSSDERVVFLRAGSSDVASRRATALLAALYDIDPLEVHLYNLASFTDLINSGVSDDEDMRVFEIGWKGPSVSAWAEHPPFLTDDTSLLGKWAELFADIARMKALEAIKRARS
ncbi:hypothetical protein [Burkholderia sp. S171]|uniref:hypothetical protein n=1 Tax=Burkholderia sp. S171 TaxID=1641860 RepID=UPI00131DEE4F|nr:hypothetical protein [Burkholderia sp. S171]